MQVLPSTGENLETQSNCMTPSLTIEFEKGLHLMDVFYYFIYFIKLVLLSLFESLYILKLVLRIDFKY